MGSRVPIAANLYHKYPSPHVFSIGIGDNKSGKLSLISNGIPASSIALETFSNSTQENASFSDSLLNNNQINSAVIVTNWWHARRAYSCFVHYYPNIRWYVCYEAIDYRSLGSNGWIKGCLVLENEKFYWYMIRFGIFPMI